MKKVCSGWIYDTSLKGSLHPLKTELWTNYFYIFSWNEYLIVNKQWEKDSDSPSNPVSQEINLSPCGDPANLSTTSCRTQLHVKIYGCRTLNPDWNEQYSVFCVQHLHIVLMTHIRACWESWQDCRAFSWLAGENLFHSHHLPVTQTAVH